MNNISYAKIYICVLVIPFNFIFPLSTPLFPFSNPNFIFYAPLPLNFPESPKISLLPILITFIHCWHLTPLGQATNPPLHSPSLCLIATYYTHFIKQRFSTIFINIRASVRVRQSLIV